MAGTTGLEPAASAVTAYVSKVTIRKSTASIASFGALSNAWKVLLHPHCTHISSRRNRIRVKKAISTTYNAADVLPAPKWHWNMLLRYYQVRVPVPIWFLWHMKVFNSAASFSVDQPEFTAAPIGRGVLCREG